MSDGYELKLSPGLKYAEDASLKTVTIEPDPFKLKIVASGAVTGETNWTGSGPYETSPIDTGFVGSEKDVIMAFYDEDGSITYPLSPNASDLSAVVFKSNSNADLYVIIQTI